MKCIAADWVLQDDRLIPQAALRVSPEGGIVAVGPLAEVAAPTDDVIQLPGGRVLLPGFVNSHSHAFQILGRGTSDGATSFRNWVDGILYPMVLQLDAEQVAAAVELAFCEMALSGITTVGEFWYIHNQQGSFARRGNQLAERVIDVARRVGLRICLLRTLYDRGSKPGQNRFKEPAGEALQNLHELVENQAGRPGVTVGAAPHSLHGASEALIRDAWAMAEQLDLPFHIHLAEQQGDLAVSDRLYGTTPLRALQRVGVVGDRLTIVHGVWLDDEEVAALGAAGGGLAYNPQSNMALGDGISKLPGYLQGGTTVSLGADGACANDEVDILLEARMAEYLQRVSKHDMGVAQKAAPTAVHPSPLFDMVTVNGGRNLRLPVGRLQPGYRADVTAIELTDLSLLPGAVKPDPARLVRSLIFSASARAVVRDVFVDGRAIVREGQLVHVDTARLVEKLQSTLGETK